MGRYDDSRQRSSHSYDDKYRDKHRRSSGSTSSSSSRSGSIRNSSNKSHSHDHHHHHHPDQLHDQHAQHHYQSPPDVQNQPNSIIFQSSPAPPLFLPNDPRISSFAAYYQPQPPQLSPVYHLAPQFEVSRVYDTQVQPEILQALPSFLGHPPQPPPHLNLTQILDEQFAALKGHDQNEEGIVPTVPYYQLPAGIMISLIKPEQAKYEPLDPVKLRLPVPKVPDVNLLQSIDEFYSDSTKALRDSSGWNTLFVETFMKQKSDAIAMSKLNQQK